MYNFVNVDKSSVAGSGAASPKDPNVAFFRREDILTWPVRDSKGVLSVGDFVMKPGKTPIYIYMTGVNQKPNYEVAGDVDKEQVMQKFEATHPGDELEAHEFLQNNIGQDLIIVYGNCSSDDKRIYGTKCSPMRLKGTFTDDKDGVGFTFNFEQIQSTRFVPSHYAGNIPYATPIATDVSIDLLVASGNQYKVESLDTTAQITIPSIDFTAGSTITLIGSGGSDPATLTEGDKTQCFIILKDGVTWTALENATISFDVYDGGSVLYLIERNRS